MHDFDQYAVVHQAVGKRLLQRLRLIRSEINTILEFGAGTGFLTQQLFEEFPEKKIWAVDISTKMLHCAKSKFTSTDNVIFSVADIIRLPFPDNSFDVLISNMMLHWYDNLNSVFVECRRVLKPGGSLLFTMCGPDTLKELRMSWAGIDQNVHMNDFIDMHHVGDILLKAGYIDPVMDIDHFTLTYSDINLLFDDLRKTGSTNCAIARSKGLTGKNKFQIMKENYEQYRYKGKLPASIEVTFGHASLDTGFSIPIQVVNS